MEEKDPGGDPLTSRESHEIWIEEVSRDSGRGGATPGSCESRSRFAL